MKQVNVDILLCSLFFFDWSKSLAFKKKTKKKKLINNNKKQNLITVNGLECTENQTRDVCEATNTSNYLNVKSAELQLES